MHDDVLECVLPKHGGFLAAVVTHDEEADRLHAEHADDDGGVVEDDGAEI